MDGKSKRVLGVFALVMINVAAIASLRALPTMAEEGFASAFFFILAALIFFLPAALISAELATGWPKRGGVYIWVKEAFGQKWGLIAIWLQWIQNVVWYPTVLSFTAATFAYLFNPSLADNPIYMLGIVLSVYWGATLLNFRGMKTSGWVSTFGVLSGTIIPAFLIIVLGLMWLGGGNPSQISFDLGSFVPDLANISTIVLAASVLLAFGGIEMSAVHAQEVKNPQKDFPKAIFISVAVIVLIFVLGTLSIATVVPQAQISLVAGLMQAFTAFFEAYHIAWLIPILALLISAGAFGQVTTWVAGPSKGLLATAKEGMLPPFFQKENKNGVQVNILIVQGLIVTALSLIFLFMPSVNSSFWILTALTAQLYLIMYILMFLAGLKLRYSQPNVKRPYVVPGGRFGIWIVAGLGILAALTGILLGFVPPSQLDTGSTLFYHTFLIGGIILMVGAPFVFYHLRKPEWAQAAKR